MAGKPKLKSADQSAESKMPALIPQRHGGALLSGGKPGNTPGTGRPPSEIRAAMRVALADRIHILQDIADGENTSDADRMKALDLLAKYGLGTKAEVTGEDGAPLQAGVVILPAVRGDGQA